MRAIGRCRRAGTPAPSAAGAPPRGWRPPARRRRRAGQGDARSCAKPARSDGARYVRDVTGNRYGGRLRAGPREKGAVTGDREHGRGDAASLVALATAGQPDGSRPGDPRQPTHPAFTAHAGHTAHPAHPAALVGSPAHPAAAATRHLAALDAIEEMACAPAQPSLLLELCVERARALVRAGGAAVQLLEGGDELLFAATSGMLRDQLGSLQAVHGTLCGTAVARGEVVRSADATIDPRGDRNMARSLGIRSTVSLPLRQRQRGIGVLLVCSDRPDVFTDTDVTLLSRLARVASSRLDFALARDARRRSEEALSASRQKYRTVLASVEQGILVIDEYDRVSMVNPAAERILGEPAYELMRRSPAWVLQH